MCVALLTVYSGWQPWLWTFRRPEMGTGKSNNDNEYHRALCQSPFKPCVSGPCSPSSDGLPKATQTVGIYFLGAASPLFLPTGQAPSGRSVGQLDKAEDEVEYGVISGEVPQRAVSAGFAWKWGVGVSRLDPT